MSVNFVRHYTWISIDLLNTSRLIGRAYYYGCYSFHTCRRSWYLTLLLGLLLCFDRELSRMMGESSWSVISWAHSRRMALNIAMSSRATSCSMIYKIWQTTILICVCVFHLMKGIKKLTSTTLESKGKHPQSCPPPRTGHILECLLPQFQRKVSVGLAGIRINTCTNGVGCTRLQRLILMECKLRLKGDL